jgi:hypothetical protein
MDCVKYSTRCARTQAPVIDAGARIAAASGKRGAAKMAGPSDGGNRQDRRRNSRRRRPRQPGAVPAARTASEKVESINGMVVTTTVDPAEAEARSEKKASA